MRVYKFVLTCAVVIFIFLHFNTVLCMKDYAYEKLDQFDDCLTVYYHPASKTLDLSRLQMGDQWLENMFGDIKHFVDKYDVKCLLLESMELTKIPVDLIDYAIRNEHLRVISLQNNKFNFQTPTYLQEGRLVVTAVTAPSIILYSGHLFGIKNISMLWDTFPQEVARDVVVQDPAYKNLPQLKKIIIIDERVRPIFVFDKLKSCYLPLKPDCFLFLSEYLEKHIKKYMEKLQSLS